MSRATARARWAALRRRSRTARGCPRTLRAPTTVSRIRSADGQGFRDGHRGSLDMIAGARRASAADVVADVVRPEIRALSAYAVSKADGLIKLDAMENPYALPDTVRSRLDRALSRV